VVAVQICKIFIIFRGAVDPWTYGILNTAENIYSKHTHHLALQEEEPVLFCIFGQRPKEVAVQFKKN
jgi:hypothetical protein